MDNDENRKLQGRIAELEAELAVVGGGLRHEVDDLVEMYRYLVAKINTEILTSCLPEGVAGFLRQHRPHLFTCACGAEIANDDDWARHTEKAWMDTVTR